MRKIKTFEKFLFDENFASQKQNVLKTLQNLLARLEKDDTSSIEEFEQLLKKYPDAEYDYDCKEIVSKMNDYIEEFTPKKINL